jgi:NitT/TauT family transport system permease protein
MTATSGQMRARVNRRAVGTALLRVGWFISGVLVLAGMWEGYKAWGPANGVHVFGAGILPRTDDTAMPHLWTIWNVLGQSDQSGSQQTITFGGSASSASSSQTVLAAIVRDCLHTLQWSAVGFVIGVAVGLGLALLMDRFRTAERAMLPYLVLSQTVPLVALAPILQQWGHTVHIAGWSWTDTTSIELIAAYLAFFPVSVGMLRGLRAPSTVHTDYFTCTAAGWFQTLRLLKLPSSVPHLVPSLRLAAAASVVGAIVAEISIGSGSSSGIGTRIFQYSQQQDSTRLFAAVFAAALLGFVAAGLVSVVDLALRRYSRPGARP